MKTCSICGEEKGDEYFHRDRTRKDGFCPRCIICEKVRRKAHRQSEVGKAARVRQVGRRKRRGSAWIEAYKAEHPCSVCGEAEVACLDFHHLDANEKATNVSRMGFDGFSEERMMTEVDKCVVLCSNCHRKVHAGILRIA